jgi:hypothetical protein
MLNNISALLDAGVAASTNSYESIQTVTVGAGGVGSITFTTIPSTYKHLQIRAAAQISTSSGSCPVEFNSDTNSSNYYQHVLFGSGASAGAASGNNNTFGFQLDSAQPGAGVMDILDYTNTNKYTTVRTLSGNDTNGGGYITLRSGLWSNTAAITNIRIYPASGNFNQYSSFALYGIKG